MTKRFGNYENGTSSKKLKIDDLDALWGEDPDIDDIDDCIMLATQISHQENFNCTQRNNVSILPSYSIFKDNCEHPLISSTQTRVINEQVPSTSAFKKPFDLCELSERVNKLEEELQTKDGEVSILRNKLSNSKTTSDLEFAKRQSEFNEKHDRTSKELKVFKCELEFKNLEISNLRKKITEITKYSNLNTTTSTQFVDNKSDVNTTNSDVKSVELTEEFQTTAKNKVFYPLKSIQSELFNLPKKEIYVPLVHNNRANINTLSILQSNTHTTTTNTITTPTIKTTATKDNSLLTTRHIYKEISLLIKCNNEELNLEENNVYINKIVFVLSELLENLQTFLREVEDNQQPELIDKLNTMFLENKFVFSTEEISLYDNREWCENELGISCRQILAVIAEIIIYNSYLAGIIIGNNPLECSSDDTFDRFVMESKKYNLLERIYQIVKLIGKLRISYLYPGFLSATTNLLKKLLNGSFKSILGQTEFYFNLFQQIVFTKPPVKVLCYIGEMLKEAKSEEFLDTFCSLPTINGFKSRCKKNIVLFSSECCVMQVYCNLYINYILNQPELSTTVRNNLDIIQFVYNLYEKNIKWIKCRESEHFQCVFAICKLAIRVMYKTLKHFLKNEDIKEENVSQEVEEILNCSMQLTQLLNFNSISIIQRDISVLTNFHKTICVLEKYKFGKSLNIKSQFGFSNLYKEPTISIITDKFNYNLWQNKNRL